MQFADIFYEKILQKGEGGTTPYMPLIINICGYIVHPTPTPLLQECIKKANTNRVKASTSKHP